MDEIKLMKEVGQHKHVVSMLGCVTINEPLCLVVEYMPHSDLLHYLRKQRSKVKKNKARFNFNYYSYKGMLIM